jgi:hypothetical protein
MKLKRGITGFWHIDDKTSIPFLNITFIKAKMHQIEYSGLYKIIDFKDTEASNNYFRISLTDKLAKQNIDILVNAHYPYYCGVTTNSECMNNNFINLPESIRQCLDSDFTYLDPINLNLKVTNEDLTELGSAELAEIKYWKSKTFGEIIFNSYD